MESPQPLRIGLVGAGGIAPAHIGGWLALGAQVSVLRRGGADRLAERFGITVIDGLDDLIAGSDVVDIVSPTPTHRDISLQAFAAGRHVVCEKPLALTTDEAVEMADAAEAAGVRLFPAHVVRYFDGYRGLKADSTTVGTLTALTLRRTVPAPRGEWFRSERAGGGLIRDLMIHDLDQALWLAGPVAEVTARQDPPAIDGVVTPPVTAHVTLTHTGGAVSEVRADWAPAGTPFRSVAELTGTTGSLRFDTADSDGQREGYLPPTSAIDPYHAQLADFADALRTGRPAAVTPADGIAAVRLVDAAYASLAAGHPITL